MQMFFPNLPSFSYSNIRNSQSPLILIPRRPANHLLTPNAASSPSPSVSGSPDQYLEAGTQRKRKMVAGIDQDELLDPVNLADPDSCFCEFQGVDIHHKLYDPQSNVDEIPNTDDAQLSPEEKIGLPMVLLHGFGASVFSWNRVMKPLARFIGSKVLAFDRPAFGLTSRILSPFGPYNSTKLNPYSMAFSVLTTLYFVDFLGAQKAILVGHSAGSLVAVNSYFDAPERVAALILVAPAIFAPRSAREENKKQNEDSTISINAESPFTKFLKILAELCKYFIQVIIGILKGLASMISSLFSKAVLALLRSSIGVMLVRIAIDKFGVAAVRSAWYDAKQVTEHILHSYTKPLKAKGWDRALVEFTIAMLTYIGSESKPPLAKRLQEIKCPVLIVTGDTDRIVPAWNAERLSKAIPGSVFKVIKNCGHLPQEEKPDEFISVVAKFLQRAFGDGTKPEVPKNLT